MRAICVETKGNSQLQLDRVYNVVELAHSYNCRRAALMTHRGKDRGMCESCTHSSVKIEGFGKVNFLTCRFVIID